MTDEHDNERISEASTHVHRALQYIDNVEDPSLGVELCNVGLTVIGAYLSRRAEDDAEKSRDAR